REAFFPQTSTECFWEMAESCDWGATQKTDQRRYGLLRPRRERPRGRRSAECGKQFPPSDGDCHTPLPLEVRKWNDTTPRACSLAVQGGQDAGCFDLSLRRPLHYSLRQLFANAAIAASRVAAQPYIGVW